MSSKEPCLLALHSRFSEDYSGTAGILDRELDFASFAGNTTCGPSAKAPLAASASPATSKSPHTPVS
jgi:hypothetical protein